jgi:hypothetical protein
MDNMINRRVKRQCPNCDGSGSIVYNGYCWSCWNQPSLSTRLKGRVRCSVEGCGNHNDQMRFVGSICIDCHDFGVVGQLQLAGRRLCVVNGCSNLAAQDPFAGSLCSSCREFMVSGKHNESQANRNSIESAVVQIAVSLESLLGLQSKALFDPTRSSPLRFARKRSSSFRTQDASDVKKVLMQKISDCAILSKRARGCLLGLAPHAAGSDPILTVRELVSVSGYELRQRKGFGHQTMREIRSFLEEAGLKPGMSKDEVAKIEAGFSKG